MCVFKFKLRLIASHAIHKYIYVFIHISISSIYFYAYIYVQLIGIFLIEKGIYSDKRTYFLVFIISFSCFYYFIFLFLLFYFLVFIILFSCFYYFIFSFLLFILFCFLGGSLKLLIIIKLS